MADENAKQPVVCRCGETKLRKLNKQIKYVKGGPYLEGGSPDPEPRSEITRYECERGHIFTRERFFDAS